MKQKQEILERIVEINDILFNIDMVDVWQEEDTNAYERLSKEKQELEIELEKIENGRNMETYKRL